MEKKVVELTHPIKHEDKEINCLTFGRLKFKHLKKLPTDFKQLSFAEMIPIIAAVAEVPEEIIDEIDFEDMGVVIDAISIFLDKSLTTGKK